VELVVRPSGRVLEVQAGETLLDALLGNQVPISHSCKDGRCGVCRCRLLRGKVVGPARQMRPSSVPGSSCVLACQSVLTEDCVIEIPAPEEVVVHPARTMKAEVVAVAPLCRDTLRLRVRPQSLLSFSPGQYVELEFERGLARPYSMCGLPGNELEFHARLHPGGRASARLSGELKPGDMLKLRGPLGITFLRSRNEDPILCVGAGTGLAPTLSILRGIAAAGMKNPLQIYLGFTCREDVYGQDELAQVLEQLPAACAHTVVATGAIDRGMRRGLLTSVIAADFPSLAGWRGYVFGSPHAVDATVRTLREKQMAEQSIYAEPFHITGN